MMLSNSGFLFAFRGQNNPLQPKIFWENIQFEDLCTPTFQGQIVANCFKKTMLPGGGGLGVRENSLLFFLFF